MIDATRYSIQVRKVDIDGEEYYHAKIGEFPYLNEYADSYTEAYDLAVEAITASAEVLEKQGKKIPEPAIDLDVSEYSGRITLRLPKTLHASLSEQAEREDVSLNQLLVSALSYFNGFRKNQYSTESIMHVVRASSTTVIKATQEKAVHNRRSTDQSSWKDTGKCYTGWAMQA